jgi:mono/diheme cytochrome c family protein
MAKVHKVPLPKISAATDADSVARGAHLVETLGGCALGDCHGKNLVGGKTIDVGPVASITAPNITNIVAAYSDGELARLFRHGIKKDGTSVIMMPVQDFYWLPDEDVAAIIGYIRALPKSDNAPPATVIKPFGKVIDRQDSFPLDIARFMQKLERLPPPPQAARTKEYGKYVARLCSGCHGESFSGGPIPGAPPDMAIPLNLTPHETGLKGWTYEDFVKVSMTGVNPKGKKLDPFMPFEALGKMTDDERGALFDYLMSLPPKEFGNR